MKRYAMAAGATGIFVIMMLAALVQGVPQITPPPDPAVSPPAQPIEAPSPMPSATPTPPPDPASDVVGLIIGMVLLVLLAAVAMLVIVLVVRALMRAWQDRPLGIADAIEVDSALDAQSHAAAPEPEAPVIRRGLAGALRLIDERAAPSDAIIAAWLGLEESAADAGIARGVSETASEFALRIMTRRAGITAEARELLGLFERVRFGGYAAVEGDRERARECLRRIEEGWR